MKSDVTLRGTVGAAAIDDNAHMNIKAYLEVFEQGSWAVWHELVAEAQLPSETTMVAGRLLVEHRCELLEGDHWELRSRALPSTDTSLVVVHRLYRVNDGESRIAATAEILCSAFSRFDRTMVPLGETMQGVLAARATDGLRSRLDRLIKGQPAEAEPVIWSVIVFMIEGYGNHAGLYIPGQGLADLSLAGARIVPLDDRRFPKGIPESFPITVPDPDAALAFLSRMGALCPEIIAQERAQRGWHLTPNAPDYVLHLRDRRSSDARNMNCVEWIAHALELGGIEFPSDVLTPQQLRLWMMARTKEKKAENG